MLSPQWRNRLETAMRRQGMPADYVDRLIDELSDHAESILREKPSIDAKELDAEQFVSSRMGSPDELAAAALCEYRQRTFAGRHPVVTFVAGPAFVLCGTFAAGVLLIFVGCWLIDAVTGARFLANDELGTYPTALEMLVIRGVSTLIRFLPFAASALLYIRWGLRSGRCGWAAVACGLIAVAAVTFFSVINPERAMWCFGFGLNFGIDQALQAVLPLACGAVMLRLAMKHERTLGAA